MNRGALIGMLRKRPSTRTCGTSSTTSARLPKESKCLMTR